MTNTNRKISVFNSVSLDGYFTDTSNDMSWAHKYDKEWADFTTSNSSGEAAFLFGRVTYQMMAAYWPRPEAQQQWPEVAHAMNSQEKYVASRTLHQAGWNNTTVLRGDLIKEVKDLKATTGPNIMIFGSGSIIAQLAAEHLIDEYQIVIIPTVLGSGRTMFEGLKNRFSLKQTECRSFSNGNTFLRYQPE